VDRGDALFGSGNPTKADRSAWLDRRREKRSGFAARFWNWDFNIQRIAHGLDILRDKNKTVLKCRLEKAD